MELDRHLAIAAHFEALQTAVDRIQSAFTTDARLVACSFQSGGWVAYATWLTTRDGQPALALVDLYESSNIEHVDWYVLTECARAEHPPAPFDNEGWLDAPDGNDPQLYWLEVMELPGPDLWWWVCTGPQQWVFYRGERVIPTSEYLASTPFGDHA